ncbi:hypothetical protein F4780DRAFT_723496 [Xylariomycetidae sp. FL0641]|nr:hypothetical protein F4780DRAFT_723496 [Xylariomycetidae sp. FL0641]
MTNHQGTAHPPTGQDDAAYQAALTGASLAFQKTSKPKPPVPPPLRRADRDNGALLAATSASRDHSVSRSPTRVPPSHISRQTTGSSVQGASNDFAHGSENVGGGEGGGNGGVGAGAGVGAQRSAQRGRSPSMSQNHLAPPAKSTMIDSRSQSLLAATLAASRSATPSPRMPPQPQSHMQQAARRQRRGSHSDNSVHSSEASLDLPTDTTSIPSTNSLVSMFEKRGGDDTDPAKKSTKGRTVSRPPSATPSSRPATISRPNSAVSKPETSPSRLAGALAWERASARPASAHDTVRQRDEEALTPTAPAQQKKRPPTPPPARKKIEAEVSSNAQSLEAKGKPRAASPPPKTVSRSDTVVLSPQPRRPTTSGILPDGLSLPAPTTKERSRPAVRPKPQSQVSTRDEAGRSVAREASRPKGTTTAHRRSSSGSSNDSFVSASSAPSPPPAGEYSPVRGRSRPQSRERARPPRPASTASIPKSVSSGYNSNISRRQTPANLQLESLTDAIMAGSLAASRVPQSRAATVAPSPRAQTPHFRPTLRKPRTSSEEDKLRHHHRKKPLRKLGQGKKHTHHEGSRKRWRDQIKERELKRYEGVWASNRGLLLDIPNTDPRLPKGLRADQVVVNVVVRDIWARSRLPFDELGEVWDLVDRRGVGVLDRTEFVVGMWLIDQRLRGRKIPQKVSDSVWGSAQGMQILSPGMKKK